MYIVNPISKKHDLCVNCFTQSTTTVHVTTLWLGGPHAILLYVINYNICSSLLSQPAIVNQINGLLRFKSHLYKKKNKYHSSHLIKSCYQSSCVVAANCLHLMFLHTWLYDDMIDDILINLILMAIHSL